MEKAHSMTLNMPENDYFYCVQCLFSSVCFMYRLPDRVKIVTAMDIDLICNMKRGYRRPNVKNRL